MKTVNFDKVSVSLRYEIINPESNFVITGYYWGHNNINKNSRYKLTYGQLAQRMIDSCKSSKCNYLMANIEEFAKPGGYQIAINYKTRFLLHVLDIIEPRSAINIDTDMIVSYYPSVFDIDADIWGINWYYDPRGNPGIFPIDCFSPYVLRTSGGIMGYSNSQPARQFLKNWDTLMLRPEMKGKAEDVVISVEFAKGNWITKLRCFWLPIEYFSIPYFYESDFDWIVSKRYQKLFRHIKFKGDESKEEYSFDEFYGIKKYYIEHPESLTAEEIAAQQGSSENRVPVEYLIEVGRKLRCSPDNKNKPLVNIPKLYCDTNEQIKSMSGLTNILDDLGWRVLEDLPKKFENTCKIDIDTVKIYNSGILFVIVGKLSTSINFNYVTLKSCECKSYVISSLMKKYEPEGIVFFENLEFVEEERLQGQLGLLKHTDFSCINSNAYPVYIPSVAEKCYDVKCLDVLTTDILFFRNNKYGRNLLLLWNQLLEDRHSLSIAFNKYGCILFMRVFWLPPEFYVLKKGRLFGKNVIINTPVLLFTGKVPQKSDINLYDYFKQCGNKPRVPSFAGNMAKNTHFRGSKFKAV